MRRKVGCEISVFISEVVRDERLHIVRRGKHGVDQENSIVLRVIPVMHDQDDHSRCEGESKRLEACNSLYQPATEDVAFQWVRWWGSP